MVVTGPVYRAARYSLVGRRVSNGVLGVRESKDKVEETGGNS